MSNPNDRMTAEQIDNSEDIAALRAHVIACGYSAAWFDLNGYGEAVRLARVAAGDALRQWTLGY